jgi:hypothetical protein
MTPEFWTSLPITLATRPRYIAFHLEKSSGSPISALLYLWQFTLRHRLLGPPPARLRTLAEFITDTLPDFMRGMVRVRRLSVECSGPAAWREVIAKLSIASATELLGMSMTFPTTYLHVLPSAGRILPTPLHFSGAGKITELRIAGAPCLWPGHAAIYRNLTVLRLLRLLGGASIDWRTFAAVLGLAPHLQVLQLSRINFDNIVHAGGVTLPSLTAFYFTYTDPAALLPISQIVFPSIANLRIHILSNTAAEFISRFAPVLGRAVTVEMCIVHFSDIIFADLLGAMPCVCSLDIVHTRPAGFEYILGLLRRRALRLPHLQEHLVGCPVTFAEVELFLGADGHHVDCILRTKDRTDSVATTDWWLRGGKVQSRTVFPETEIRSIADEWAIHENRRVV